MSTRFLVPIRKGMCLSRPAIMPEGLAPYCHPDDFTASMSRIEAANTSPILARLAYVVSWVGYVMGLVYVLNTDYYASTRFWTSFGVLFISLGMVIGIGRYMRQRRAEKVAAAIAAEHANYSSRATPLSWTLIRLGWYRQAVEIDVLASAQQLQIQSLQHQLAMAQHEAARDYAIVQQQAAVQSAEVQLLQQQQRFIEHQAHAQAHPQFYPVVAAPRPVYSPQHSVFAHPAPQYVAAAAPAPAAYPDSLRTPLYYSQY